MIEFSIILPIYKQSKQLKKLISEYLKKLKSLNEPFELILVINGGDKDSYEIAKKLITKYSSLKVFYLQESGWGNAVIAGIKASKGKFICYTNSARTRLSDLLLILKYAKRNPDVVIKATRILHINLLRKLGSTLYNIECRLLLHTPVWDVNGTPKVGPAKVFSKINLSSKDDLIDAEFMAKCLWNNVPVLEVPILFPDRYGGKSTTKFLSALKMYLGVIRIRQMLSLALKRSGEA